MDKPTLVHRRLVMSRLPDWNILPAHGPLQIGGYYVVPGTAANEGPYKGIIVRRHRRG